MAIDPTSSTFADELRAFVDRVRRETGVPGIGAAVSVDGRRVFARAGTVALASGLPLGADARFQLGCVMKLLLALVALELAARGSLDLDRPIGELLPEIAPTEHGREIRIKHLLSHTSGYQGTDVLSPAARAFSWETFVAYLRAAPRFFRPGAVFNYEHSEAVLLERVLERATGESAVALVRRIVLEPLGCGALVPSADVAPRVRVAEHRFDARLGAFVPEPARQPARFWQAAFSHLTLTLADVLAVGEALAGAGPRGALARSAEAACKTVVALPPMAGGPLRELLPVAFGAGVAMLSGGWLGSTGIAGGQCIGLRFEPRERIAIVVGLNAFAPHVRDLVLTAIGTRLIARAPGAEMRAVPTVALEGLGGTYRGGGDNVLRAVHRDGRLVCQLGKEGSQHALRIEIDSDARGCWRVRSAAPQLSIGAFHLAETGEPVVMIGLAAYKRTANASNG